MPVNETSNTITVGTVCLSCGLYATKTCPYGNHKKTDPLEFKGDIRGKCTLYQPIKDAAKKEHMEKIAETKLNVSLYRKLRALKKEERDHLFKYWDSIFPKEYAKDMVTDETETTQRDIGGKGRGKKDKKEKKKTKFPDEFKTKETRRTSKWYT